MYLLSVLGVLSFYVAVPATYADFALVGELNLLSVGSHISMAPMNTLAFDSLKLGSMGDPHGIDFDPIESMIYWTDRRDGTITRARLDGSNRRILFSNAQAPHGIAIDTEDRLMYWAEEGRRSIWRANLNGSNRTRIISTELKEPSDIAFDPVEKRIYWADENGIHSKIESAKVDGSDRKKLIFNNLHRTWLKHPTGIALDIMERKLYWCDDKLDYIGSADLNGSNIVNIFDKSHWWIPDLLYQPESIAVYGKYIYFVELLGFQVQRIPKDGSEKPRKVGQVETILLVPYGPLQGPVDLFIHTDFNYCGASPCKQGGKCKGGPGWFRCDCAAGTGGALCEEANALSNQLEPFKESRGSGASVGGILGGILLIVLIIAIVAIVCYRRGRGDGRHEGDTIPIVFATGNQSEPSIQMTDSPSPSKAMVAQLEEELKCQDLGACGSSFDMKENPPTYYEAMKQNRPKKSDYEPLII